MNPGLRRNKDFLAGLIFLAFGWAAIVIADNDYPMGTAMRMGPGNFPVALGLILGGSVYRTAIHGARGAFPFDNPVSTGYRDPGNPAR